MENLEKCPYCNNKGIDTAFSKTYTRRYYVPLDSLGVTWKEFKVVWCNYCHAEFLYDDYMSYIKTEKVIRKM